MWTAVINVDLEPQKRGPGPLKASGWWERSDRSVEASANKQSRPTSNKETRKRNLQNKVQKMCSHILYTYSTLIKYLKQNKFWRKDSLTVW